MIQQGTQLEVADNTGAKLAVCIKVLGGSRRRYANIGDIIVIAVKLIRKDTKANAKVKKGDVSKAVVVRTKSGRRRKDSSHIRFGRNSVVLISPQGEPMGTRVFGTVGAELRDRGYNKIISMAEEVL